MDKQVRSALIVLFIVGMAIAVLGGIYLERSPSSALVASQSRGDDTQPCPSASEQTGLTASSCPTVAEEPAASGTAPAAITPSAMASAPRTAAIAPEASALIATDHDPLHWHPPTDHHHGVNPLEIAPDLAAYFPMIGIPENGLRSPDIKEERHRGDVWLYADASEHLGDGICEHSAHAPAIKSGAGCVKRVLLRIHNVGHEPHSQVRFHTVSFVAEVCTQDGSQCGVIAGHELVDYGTAHCPYKREYCGPEYDQADVPVDLIAQSPYRTSKILAGRLPGASGVSGFWAAQGLNPAVARYYPSGINALIRPGWANNDAWQYLEQVGGEPKWVCDLLGESEGCAYNGSQYQVFTVIIMPPTTERPFSGFVHTGGTLNSSCTEAGPDCYPLFISETVPAIGVYSLARKNLIGNPDAAPIFEFDTGSGITRP